MNLLKVISMKAKLFSTVVFMMIMLSILSYLNTVEEIKIYQDGKVTQLKSIVDFSYSRLEDLYKKMNDRGLSEEYIRKLYYSEMTAMQYDNGNGYVFLISKDGTMLLNPNKPSLNGINQINLKDSNGVLWVKEVIDVSMDKNRDLAEYTLRKPSNNKTTKKMTYAKYYAPLDIVVASGSYMDDIEKVERDLIRLFIEELLILGLIVLITSFIVIKDFNKAMAKLKDDMIELSHGNTSIKIDLSRGDEIGKMAECLDVFKTNTIAMNKAKDQELEKAKEDTKSKNRVQGLVGNIAQESLVVEDHISGISIAASELSSTLEDITNKVNETSTMTDLAQNEAEKGQSTISDLSNSAVKIGEVVDLIKDIAEKTNLLALNASIEAARAGEEGRGFAVVAEEVKKLAQQTSDATNDISNLVKTIQKNSGNSVDSIGQISEQISSINDVTKQLVISMAEQRSATNDISERMVQASEGSKEVSEKIKEIND